MSDSAFKTAPYPSYTTAQLRERAADPQTSDATAILMQNEIERRDRVAAGDRSIMTPSERLRFAKFNA